MTLFNFSIPARPPLSPVRPEEQQPKGIFEKHALKIDCGFTPDAKFDVEGFGNTLAARAEIKAKRGSLPADPQKHIDRYYYQGARAAPRR